MATCSVSAFFQLQQIGAASACAEKHGAKPSEARFAGSSRIGSMSSKSLGLGSWSLPEAERMHVGMRAQASGGSLQQQSEEGVSLATALLPDGVNLGRLESLLFQWGNSLTANANLPLPTALKVDKVKGGVRLGYIRLNDGAIEDLVHIDVTVHAAEGDQKAYFQATRNGQYKDKVPPAEPLIMQSLLQALRKSIQIARE